MVDIRPNQLPDAILPLRETDELVVDQGADGVRKAPPIEAVNSVAPVASQAEAVAGADNTKRMTPLRTKQSIASEVGVTIASNSQGEKADSAVQTVNGKSGNSVTLVKGDVGLGNVDNTSDADKPISTATQNALDAKANSSVTISAGTGLTGGGNLTANRTVSLNAASIASLAKADSAVQTVNGVAPTGGNVTVAAEEKRLQDTRTTAMAESFGSNVLFVETAGYSSVGDGGGALYKRVVSEPAHAGKFQSADGAWWELAENRPNVKMFGAVGDGVTVDQSAITGAVNYGFLKKTELFWPDGDYLSNANIPDFHSIRNIGLGKIKIGSLLWRFDALPTTVNVLHVLNSGSDTNDGLAGSGRALKTIQRALDILSNIGEAAANGRWRIQFGAEIYDQTAFAPDLPMFTNMLELRGVLSAVPSWGVGQTVEAGDYRLSGDGHMLYRAESHGVTGSARPLQPYGVSSDGNVQWRYIGGERPWIAGAALGLYRYRQNAGNLYYAIPGTGDSSGTTPPTHTSGNVSDGGTVWQYVGPHLPIPTQLPATRIRGALNAPLWGVTPTVKAGDPRRHGDRIYIAMASGSIGTIAPTHTSGIVATDGVPWKYIGLADESLGATGIWIQPGTRVNLYGLAFSQFQSTMFGDYGFLMENKDFLLTQNCVFENNSIAVGAIGHVTHTMQNSLVVSNGNGPFTTYNSKIAIGTRSNTGCFLVNNDTGAYISRGTIAHCDFTGLIDNRNGLTVSILSRVHCLGSQFRGNQKPLWVIGGGEWVNNPNPKNSFFWGKVGTGNTEAPRQDGFSRIDNVHNEQSQAEIRYYRSFTTTNITTTGSEVLAHQANRDLPVDWFLDNSKKLRVVVSGKWTGTSGAKNLRVALGTSTIASLSGATTTGDFIFEVEAAATGFSSQRAMMKYIAHNESPKLLTGSDRAIPILDGNGDNASLQLRVYTTLSSGDTLTIYSVEWFITG